jgi:hypothetical protein
MMTQTNSESSRGGRTVMISRVHPPPSVVAATMTTAGEGEC